MSTKKAKPRKSTSTRKKKTTTPQEKETPVPSEPIQLEREDHLVLKLAYTELQNKQFGLREAVRQYEASQKEVGEAQETFNNQLTAVNTKYNLDVNKDKIDLDAGTIIKGGLQPQGK